MGELDPTAILGRLEALEARPRSNGVTSERSGISIGLAFLIFGGLVTLLGMVFNLQSEVRIANDRTASFIGRLDRLESTVSDLRERMEVKWAERPAK
jgi:hypothetical protein